MAAPAQRQLGRYWKRLQKTTYAIWVLVVLDLLLDGFTPFGAADGDGDPVMHQRFITVCHFPPGTSK